MIVFSRGSRRSLRITTASSRGSRSLMTVVRRSWFGLWPTVTPAPAAPTPTPTRASSALAMAADKVRPAAAKIKVFLIVQFPQLPPDEDNKNIRMPFPLVPDLWGEQTCKENPTEG